MPSGGGKVIGWRMSMTRRQPVDPDGFVTSCASALRAVYHFRAASECAALISLYRWARSRSARDVMLTRYATLGFEIVEKRSRRQNDDRHLSRLFARNLAATNTSRLDMAQLGGGLGIRCGVDFPGPGTKY